MNDPDPTHVYAIYEDGALWKIGESAQRVNGTGLSVRAQQQARDLARLNPDKVYETEIRAWKPNKADARSYETQVIERYRAMYGQDKLPGNKANR